MSEKPRIKYVCSKCGGDEISWDADAYWNVEAQDFIVGGVHDTSYCGNCDGECSIRRVEIDRPAVPCRHMWIIDESMVEVCVHCGVERGETDRPAAQRLAMGDQVARDRALGFKL